MAEKSWTEQAIDNFFEARKTPARRQCDELALSITGASAVRPVDIPGSLSYTVVCTTRIEAASVPTEGLKSEEEEEVVVSFRELGSGLDEGMVELARVIHGSLVPKTTYQGMVDDSEPPLRIYTMPLLPGIACSETLSYEVNMDPDERARHFCLVRELARYFARCWSAPQPVESRIRTEHQAAISHKLSALKASPFGAVSNSTISELEHVLPQLFATDYPQVLTHGDLSKTNILVNPDTYEITGVIDWSLVAVQPFGFELDCLVLMVGFMDLKGWHDYDCRPQLWDTFWAEFWNVSGIKDDDNSLRENIRATAEAAAKIGAVLRYAFDRNSDGRSSEVLTTSDNMLELLKACFTEDRPSK